MLIQSRDSGDLAFPAAKNVITDTASFGAIAPRPEHAKAVSTVAEGVAAASVEVESQARRLPNWLRTIQPCMRELRPLKKVI